MHRHDGVVWPRTSSGHQQHINTEYQNLNNYCSGRCGTHTVVKSRYEYDTTKQRPCDNIRGIVRAEQVVLNSRNKYRHNFRRRH